MADYVPDEDDYIPRVFYLGMTMRWDAHTHSRFGLLTQIVFYPFIELLQNTGYIAEATWENSLFVGIHVEMILDEDWLFNMGLGDLISLQGIYFT